MAGAEPLHSPLAAASVEFELIETRAQLAANIAWLEAIRIDPTSANFTVYVAFVERGTCLLPYRTEDGLAFAPPRLLGYQTNDFARHAAN